VRVDFPDRLSYEYSVDKIEHDILCEARLHGFGRLAEFRDG
jgi:hypothetical protein